MEEHLTRALGVRLATRPDGKAREVVGVDQEVMDLFSSRRRAITRRPRSWSPRSRPGSAGRRTRSSWTGCSGRPPSPPATAKSHDGRDPRGAARPVGRAAARRGRRRPGRGRRTTSLDRAQAGHRRRRPGRPADGDRDRAGRRPGDARRPGPAPDLTRAISDALPDYLGRLDGARGRPAARRADRRGARSCAVPLDAGRPGDAAAARRAAAGRRRVGLPGARRPAVRHARPPAHRAAPRRGRRPRTAPRPCRPERGQRFLDRAARVRASSSAPTRPPRCAAILTSGARVETLVGPAGTGKSLRRRRARPGLARPGPVGRAAARRVVGLATSQVATEVLAGEGLHRPQHRPLARHPGPARRRPGTAPAADDDEAWRLRAGDLVVVDESAMADTAALAAIHRHVEAAGAKLLLVGDHRQLAAVGAGGGMDLLAARRRPLRAGRGPPVHPRVGARGVAAAARRRRDRAARLPPARPAPRRRHRRAGRGRPPPGPGWPTPSPASTSLLIVDTNEQAARLSAQLRAELVRLGRVDGGRRAARAAGHLRRGRRPRPGPPQRLGPRRLRGQPPRPDQPRDLPRHRRPRRRRPRGRRARSADEPRRGRADRAARPTTSPSTWRSATPPPCTPPRASPSTPATPSSPGTHRRRRAVRRA